MAKQKYEIGKVLTGDIVGTLDYAESEDDVKVLYTEDGQEVVIPKRVIIVDGVERDLEELLDQIMGAEVQIKINKPIIDEE